MWSWPNPRSRSRSPGDDRQPASGAFIHYFFCLWFCAVDSAVCPSSLQHMLNVVDRAVSCVFVTGQVHGWREFAVRPESVILPPHVTHARRSRPTRDGDASQVRSAVVGNPVRHLHQWVSSLLLLTAVHYWILEEVLRSLRDRMMLSCCTMWKFCFIDFVLCDQNCHHCPWLDTAFEKLCDTWNDFLKVTQDHWKWRCSIGHYVTSY